MGDPQQKLQPITQKIGFIGAGNMAKAICEGIIKKGLVKYDQIYASGPTLEHLLEWEKRGAHVCTQNGKIVDECDVIVLAVKPQILPVAIANMYETISKKHESKLFISVLAGVTLQQLETVLSELEGSRIIRTMPNTPMIVGEGCTVFCPGQRATQDDIDLVKRMMEVAGVCRQVPESLINPIGALSGSGPAYVCLMIEALADGGVKMGIPREIATEFAAQTFLGAAKMVKESGRHVSQLKDEICSPGGTTITGIHALERGGVRAALMDAVEVATKRSEELGQKHHGRTS